VSDTRSLATTPSPDLSTDPSSGTDERGRLDIAGRAIERIATHAAGRVVGVTSSGSGLDRIVGRRLPRASSTVAGDTVRLSLDLALSWPGSAGTVARQVRTEVAQQVGQLTGLSVAAVDVTIARFEPAKRPSTRRVE